MSSIYLMVVKSTIVATRKDETSYRRLGDEPIGVTDIVQLSWAPRPFVSFRGKIRKGASAILNSEWLRESLLHAFFK